MRYNIGESRVPWSFDLLFSLIVLMFDAPIGYGLVFQLQALRYPSVSGAITYSSVVKDRSGSDDPSYTYSVQYTYEVDGHRYGGDRYRYGVLDRTGRRTAEAVVSRFPPGSAARVFYNPEDPSDAVLVPGVQGFDLLALLVLAPFNFALLMGWHTRIRRRSPEQLVGAFARNGRTHVTLANSSPLLAGVGAVLGANFVAIPLVVFTFGAEPPLGGMVMLYAVMAVIGVLATWWRKVQLDAGEHDLILDEWNRRLSVPATLGRTSRTEVPFGRVQAVTLEPHTKKDSDGDSITTWRLVLLLTDEEKGVPQPLALADWRDEDRAGAVVEWLKSRLKVREPPGNVRLSA